MEKLHCAIDGGNSSIKVIVDQYLCPFVIPSIICDADREYTDNSKRVTAGNPNHRKLHVKLQKNRTINNHISEFILGQMAEGNRKTNRNRENFNKSADPELVEWMLTALAYGIYDKVRKEKGMPQNQIKAEIVLSVGLPFHEAKDSKNKRRFEKSFKGNHIIEFQHPAFDGASVELHVSKVYINVEGQASLERIIFDPTGEYGDLQPEHLLDRIFTMLNVGGFTTQISTIKFLEDFGEQADEFSSDYKLYVNPETQAHLTTDIKQGVGSAMINTIKDIEDNEKSINRKLIRRDIENAISRLGYNPNANTEGWIKPEMLDINGYFLKHIRELAILTAQKLHSLYNTNNINSQLHAIYLSGGGSQIKEFVDTFKSQMGNYGYNADIIIKDNNPIFAEVEGYYDILLEMEENYIK